MAKIGKAVKQAVKKAKPDISEARKRAAVAEMRDSGIIGKKSILRDDYKPKLKNEKESYAAAKRTGDYSDFIKNSQRIRSRKRRNRAALVGGSAVAAAAIQSKKDKENKK